MVAVTNYYKRGDFKQLNLLLSVLEARNLKPCSPPIVLRKNPFLAYSSWWLPTLSLMAANPTSAPVITSPVPVLCVCVCTHACASVRGKEREREISLCLPLRRIHVVVFRTNIDDAG